MPFPHATRLLIAATTVTLLGCEPTHDRRSTPPVQAATPKPVNEVTSIGGGSALGKAAGAAQNTRDQMDVYQQQVIREAEKTGNEE